MPDSLPEASWCQHCCGQEARGRWQEFTKLGNSALQIITETPRTSILWWVRFVEEKLRFYFVPSLFEGFSHGLSPMPCNISEQSGKTDRWKHRGMERSWFICSWNTAVGLLPSHIDVVATQTETRRTACANINTATRDEGSPSSCKHQGRKRKKRLN